MNPFFGISSSGIKNILFTIIIMMLVLPGLQGRYNFITEKSLTGAFVVPTKPDFGEFTWNSWLSGSFQEDYNNRIEQHIGFRNSLVRVHNQIDYSAFNQANAEGVIVGRKHELFEEDYLKEYTGQYFVGEAVWKKKARQLKAVQDTLARLGKSLVIIFEPGKGSFYPELAPAKYRNVAKTVSNYEAVTSRLNASGVNVLDLNQYFIALKGKTEYPLFPQCGTHWSYYGAILAADTTIKYLEKLRGINLPDMKIVRNEILDTTRHPDYDIGLAMNLLFRIPHPKTANPVIRIEQGPFKTKPEVLIIGDSFYFNWLNNRIPTETFGNCDFWYYNKNITKSDGLQAGVAADLDFQGEIMKRDIVIIMITERFLHAFAWGFDEQLYDLFYPGYRDPVDVFADKIRTYGDEFKRIKDESLAMNISLPDRINKEANYLFYNDYKSNPDKYTEKHDLIRLYEMGIRGTPEWLEEIKRKAKVNKISVDEQIRIDAEWIYEDKMKNK
jgi:hypothetical protein